MSHFTVLIIGKDPEKQLAPFQENNMGDCPEEYLEFNSRQKEFEEEWATGKTKQAFNTETMERCWAFDDRFKKKEDDIFGKNFSSISSTDSHKLPKGWIEKEFSYKEIYITFEHFCNKYHGHEEKDSQKGEYGYWENPNAKWDWYSLGGRWRGYLKMKENAIGRIGDPSWMNKDEPDPLKRADQAFKGDVDWEGMKWEQREKAILNWQKNEEEQSGKKEKTPSSYFNYGIKKDQTRDDYIGCYSSLGTFAVLKDGQWHEKGQMGWFGFASNEKGCGDWEKEFIKLVDGVPDNELLSIYDCHI